MGIILVKILENKCQVNYNINIKFKYGKYHIKHENKIYKLNWNLIDAKWPLNSKNCAVATCTSTSNVSESIAWYSQQPLMLLVLLIFSHFYRGLGDSSFFCLFLIMILSYFSHFEPLHYHILRSLLPIRQEVTCLFCSHTFCYWFLRILYISWI